MKNVIFVLLINCLILNCTNKKSEDEFLAQLGLSWNDKFKYPEIYSLTPLNNATEIEVDQTIRIVFSKPMNRSATESSLSVLAGGGGNTNYIPTWSLDQVLDLTFPNKLTAGTSYEVNVSKNNTKDKDGSFLQRNFLSKFYTVGLSNRPTITSSSPPNTGALITGWAVNNDIVITFSESMDQAATGSAVSLSGGPAAFVKVWKSDSKQITLKLLSDLEKSTNYVLKVTTSAKSARGVSLTSDYIVNFSTGGSAANPELIKISTPTLDFPTLAASPNLNTVTGVSKNDSISFFFSNAMNLGSTINAISFSPSIEGDFDWLSSTNLKFTPKAPLLQEQVYRLQISNSATNSSNLPLLDKYIIDFTVNDSFTSQAVTFIGLNGRYYTAGICTLNAAVDWTLTGLPDDFTQYIINPELTCSNQYEIEVLLNTSGASALKTSGTGDIFSKFSFSYISGSPAPSTPTISSINYIPSGNPQRVRLRLRNITNLMRYKFTIKGGSSGVTDSNLNFLKNNVELILYDN
jgi:hypothetical protein